MFKKIQLFFLLVLSFAWFACQKVDIQFGTQFVDNDLTQIIRVDTFSANISTVYVDSFVTSAKGVTILGGFADPLFGRANVNTYFEVVPPTYIDSFANTTFDSLALIFIPNKNYYGDTTQLVHVDVNRLVQPIVGYQQNTLILYNTQSFAIGNTPIGSADVILRPQRADTIKVRLDDNLGREILSKLQDPNDINVKTSDAFLAYFNGLRLSSPSNSLIFGCKDSVIMRLYYKKPGLYLQGKTWDFTLANKNHHFTNITVDRSGTVLQNLATARSIPSSTAGNAAYSLYTAGAMAKISFPTVRDILKLTNFVKLVKATLVVRPLIGSYGPLYVLPPQLRLSTTTQLNQIGSDVLVVTNGAATEQYGSLYLDGLYGQDTNYSYDLTSYMKTLIADGTINQNGLLLLPPSPALETQFNRVAVGNSSNKNSQLQLVLIYAAVVQ